jgi:hypothetical protein
MAKILIDYIRQNGIDALIKNFAINAKRHSKYPNLILFKYNQIESPMSEPIVQECRGIILDEANDWKVVCYPFKKFFNYGESNAAHIHWDGARVYEKLDGSLMTLYYYDNHWEVSSSGMPDAAGTIMGTNTTFAELFWKVWTELGYKLPISTNYSFMFELMTPFNRVVVKHTSNKIVLHGVRRMSDFAEFDPVTVASEYGWECAKVYSLRSWDDVIEHAAKFDPMEHEGFVVCDAYYSRVKVKSPAYLNIAHLRDGFSTRRMLEIVRANESSEFLSYYPEFIGIHNDIKCRYERLLGQIEGYYDAIKHIEIRKDFAAQATTQKFSGLLFGYKYGKIDSFKHGISEMNIRTLEEWLGIKSVEL